jgi:hypothetical protein
MDFDIRFPVGALFLAIGAMLAFQGWMPDPRSLQQSLGVNVNLIWGLAMVLFGAFMTALAVASRRR